MINICRWLVCAAIAGLALAGCDVNPSERINTGNNYYNQGSYAQAVQAYQAAQVVAPDDPAAYYNAGSALMRVGRADAAIAALEQAIKTADNDLIVQALYNLGNVYFEAIRYEEAVNVYREALTRRPDDEDIRYNYELALSRLLAATPPPSGDEPDEESTEEDPAPDDSDEGEDSETPEPEPGTPEPQDADDGTDADNEDEETPVTPEPDGTLNREDAERILDAVEQNQQTLREYIQQAVTPEVPPSGRDW